MVNIELSHISILIVLRWCVPSFLEIGPALYADKEIEDRKMEIPGVRGRNAIIHNYQTCAKLH